MKKAEYIRKYGITAYEKIIQQHKVWKVKHRKEINLWNKKWEINNPLKVLANKREQYCKGGKRYEKNLEDNRTGLRGKRNHVRGRHHRLYTPFKKIIAPGSQFHHQWIPGTADYTGVALVEADQHMHGYIDVIKILEGEITLLTEAEIRGAVM